MPYVAEHEVVAPEGATLLEIAAQLGPPPWRRPLAASPALRAVLWGWPAGFVTVPHVHPRAEELFQVLAGRAAFELAGEAEKVLGPGEVLLAPRGVEHVIRVIEGDPLVLLIVLGPNEDAADETIERPVPVAAVEPG
jgi:quercetin dioxygenase-like cupin family protein